MLISGREAAAVLAEGAGLNRRQARRVLASGLAGEPTITPAVSLFDGDRVSALARWPSLDLDSAAVSAPRLFIARRDLCVTAPAEEQRRQAGTLWRFPIWTGPLLGLRLDFYGRMAFVVTIAGFVATGADLVQIVGGAEPGSANLVLEPPGDWYAAFEGHRLPTPPGGRGWVLREPDH